MVLHGNSSYLSIKDSNGKTRVLLLGSIGRALCVSMTPKGKLARHSAGRVTISFSEAGAGNLAWRSTDGGAGCFSRTPAGKFAGSPMGRLAKSGERVNTKLIRS